MYIVKCSCQQTRDYNRYFILEADICMIPNLMIRLVVANLVSLFFAAFF